jgi:hypothetical protein
MLLLVAHKLIRHPLAMIKFPDAEKLESYAQLINQHEPEVDDVIGFMDSLSLISECTSQRCWSKTVCTVVTTVTLWSGW